MCHSGSAVNVAKVWAEENKIRFIEVKDQYDEKYPGGALKVGGYMKILC